MKAEEVQISPILREEYSVCCWIHNVPQGFRLRSNVIHLDSPLKEQINLYTVGYVFF